MKVFCPRCNTGYEIDDELLKLKSRRMRCGVCGEIFTVDKIVEEDVSENAFGMLQEAMGGQSKEDKNHPVDEPALVAQKDVAAEAPKDEHTVQDDAKPDENSTTEDTEAKNSEAEDEEFDI